MNIKHNLIVAVLMTIVTTILLGLIYPLAVTGLSQVLFPDNANGQLIERNGKVIGSRIIGQPFSSPGYFHPRPSAAGSGYDAASSSGTNLGPTNKKLVDAVKGNVEAARKDNPNVPVPIDLVTSSASGLDPHLSPAAAPQGSGARAPAHLHRRRAGRGEDLRDAAGGARAACARARRGRRARRDVRAP